MTGSQQLPHQSHKIKVLLVVPEFHLPIGILARYIAQSDDEIDFYFFSESGINQRTYEFLQLTSHVDVVHFLSNLNTINLPPDVNVKTLPCPTVATVHHVESGQDYKIEAASKAHVLHVTACEWVDYVSRRSNSPVHLAHQTINAKKYKPNQRTARPHFPFRIGSFGLGDTLNSRKRIDVLLGALSILRAMNQAFELVVQGPSWGKLTGFFQDQGIAIRNLGFVSSDRLWRSYRDIDLYVCTSDVEGGPLTVLEALASGVPVVSTPVGVAESALRLGGGILVEKNNPRAIADAVSRLLHEHELYKRLSCEAENIVQQYSWAGISQEYISLYQMAISQWEKKNKRRWISPTPLSIAPARQRRKELSFAHFREARTLINHGSLPYSLSLMVQAIMNTDLSVYEKLAGFHYVIS